MSWKVLLLLLAVGRGCQDDSCDAQEDFALDLLADQEEEGELRDVEVTLLQTQLTQQRGPAAEPQAAAEESQADDTEHVITKDHNGKVCMLCSTPSPERLGDRKYDRFLTDCGSESSATGPSPQAMAKPAVELWKRGEEIKGANGFCTLNFAKSCADAVANQDLFRVPMRVYDQKYDRFLTDCGSESSATGPSPQAMAKPAVELWKRGRFCLVLADYSYFAKSIDFQNPTMRANVRWDGRYCHLNGFLEESDMLELSRQEKADDMLELSRQEKADAPSLQEAETMAAWNCAPTPSVTKQAANRASTESVKVGTLWLACPCGTDSPESGDRILSLLLLASGKYGVPLLWDF
ncbi:hypothetical protein AK812_SmicGene20389 [Symbiodinium microadriaticum]|uniref:Uncharacterized protein n=1 Tax=Symbiodinium microadriaticum TaxID=2951 RepID=A0A1Q9DQ54_SYMMI|nr:hypothetical protein AK812_SmicGene20389 [Symbiodinium microadriaticum]